MGIPPLSKRLKRSWRPRASNSLTKTEAAQACAYEIVGGRKRPNSQAHFEMSLTPYFAWGCFSISLFRSANGLSLSRDPLMSHFGETNPMSQFVLAKRTQS